MYRIIIHIDSNIFSRLNIDKAKRMLLFSFPDIIFTDYVITIPTEEENSYPFRNILGQFYTDLTVEELIQKIKSIEYALGKRPRDKEQGKVVIDIDLLQYGDIVLREDDLEKDHLQKLITQFDDKKEASEE